MLIDSCSINGRRIEFREDEDGGFSVHDFDPFDQSEVPSVWEFRDLDDAVSRYLDQRAAARHWRTAL